MYTFIVGQKFPKGLEMSLQANVHFFEQEPAPSSADSSGVNDFCIGVNSYIDVSALVAIVHL